MKKNEFEIFIDAVEKEKKNLEEKLPLLLNSLKEGSMNNEKIIEFHQMISNFINKFEIEAQKIRKAVRSLDKENRIYLEETAFDLCQFITDYWNLLYFLKKECDVIIPTPLPTIYSTMQKIAYTSKKYNKKEKDDLKSKFLKLDLPIKGFENKFNFGFFTDMKPIILSIYTILCGIGLYLNTSEYNNVLIIGTTIFLYAIVAADKLSGFPYFILRIIVSILVAYTLMSLFGNELELSGKVLGVNFKAFGGTAIFIFIYRINPNKTEGLK